MFIYDVCTEYLIDKIYFESFFLTQKGSIATEEKVVSIKILIIEYRHGYV